MHRRRQSVPGRLRLHPNDDLRWALPHHRPKKRAAHPDMHSGGIALPYRGDMHANRDLFWNLHRDDTTSSSTNVLHRRWRALSNRVYMYSNYDLWRTLPHHRRKRRAANPAMHSGGIAMPYRGDMHSNRDLFWSLHRDDTTSSSTNVLHRRWRALSNRVYMYSNHDLRRTLPHHRH